jgi:transcription termination/antitermination protein NusG
MPDDDIISTEETAEQHTYHQAETPHQEPPSPEQREPEEPPEVDRKEPDPEQEPQTVEATAEEAAPEEPSEELSAEEEASEVEPEPVTAAAVASAEGTASEEQAPLAEPSISDENKNWYIIHTYSGFEQKVADSLRGRAQAFGFADKIGQILIPTEEVMELRAGKKVTSKRLLYPGYVLVQMEMNDQLWHEVKNTPRVTGFVGGGNSPVPLSSDEVNSILYRQQTSAKTPRPKMSFEKNETVKIIDGPFANFSGKIDEINSERNTLRVLVTIFGRATPVELDFLQVEKM